MTRPADTDAIARATGTPWAAWLAWFEEVGGRDTPHRELAARLVAERGVDPWWAQMTTVAWEQHIGRRAPGQTCDGRFATSASRTLPGTMDEALTRWLAWADAHPTLDGVPLDGPPSVRQTETWRYWRCTLADGSRVNVNIAQKGADRATVGVQHEKLDDADAVARWRAFWRGVLASV